MYEGVEEELVGVWILNMEDELYAFDIYSGNLVLKNRDIDLDGEKGGLVKGKDYFNSGIYNNKYIIGICVNWREKYRRANY